MPVGTQGAVKAIDSRDLEEAGAEIILGNTYHLYAAAGRRADRAPRRAAPVHRLEAARSSPTAAGIRSSAWPTAQDHGRAACEFRSHLDGSAPPAHPGTAVDIQARLGSDIAMVLDECPALPATARTLIGTSLELTATVGGAVPRALSRTALRRVRTRSPTRTGPVRDRPGRDVPGTAREKRRTHCVAVGFEGYAIGGLSVGEPNETMYKVVEHDRAAAAGRSAALPDGRRHARSTSSSASRAGIDMFDCVMPTRNARNGQLFTSQGPINIKNARTPRTTAPVDPACGCYTCRHLSRAYLAALFMAGEMTGGTLNTLHNLQLLP